MAVRIHLFTQKTRDLKCGHDTRWAGALEGSLGEHLIAMGCATCVHRQDARDTLSEFALYVQLTSDFAVADERAGIARGAAS